MSQQRSDAREIIATAGDCCRSTGRDIPLVRRIRKTIFVTPFAVNRSSPSSRLGKTPSGEQGGEVGEHDEEKGRDVTRIAGLRPEARGQGEEDGNAEE